MKRTAMIVALLLPLAVWGQKSTLSIHLKGLPTGSLMVVSEPQAGRLLPTDTLIIDDRGTVRVERRLEEPFFFTVTPLGERGALLHCLLLPRERVTLDAAYEADGRSFRIEGVKGSHNMELYRQFNNLMAEAQANPAQGATVPARLEAMLRENKEHLMSAFLVTYFESAFDQYASLYKELRDALIGRYPHNEFVMHLDQRVRTLVLEGMEAPDIAMTDSTGAIRRLSDLRGKVVLIDFWASWCRPCRAENPNVVRLYHKYHDRGFEIFSVSLDNDRGRWLAAIKTDGLVWPNHVSDLRGWSSAGGKLYGISSIPATVLVDREGNVVARNLRGAQLENKLKEILGE